MTTLKTRVLGLVMAAGCLTSAAAAQAPALDLVSPDTPIVIGVKSLAELSDDAKHWADSVLPDEVGMQMMMVDQMLMLPGLDRSGSMAVALTMPEGTMNAEPMPTMVLPVSDFGAFVEALQGNPSDSIAALNMGGQTLYAKDAPGDFIIMSPVMGLVEDFDADGGNAARHARRMGAQGSQAADGADLFVVVDVNAMRPMLDDALEEMEGQMQFAAMMGGEAAAQQIETLMSVAHSVVEDARTVVIGLGLGESGVRLDFAGQFAGNSDTGKIFADAGHSSKLLGSVPNMDYIFAMAYDSSSEGIRKLMSGAAEMQGASFTINSAEMADLSTGQAMVMGTTPGLFAGGLFTNTVAFTATDHPAKLHAAMKDVMSDMDGQSQDGMKFATTYEEGAADVGGKSLDSWGFQMEPDYNHENAAAVGMAVSQMSMLFGGQAGPTGYVATTEEGLYTTFARNSRLMENVLDGGDSMAANAQIKAAAEQLPENRTAEMYLNIKGVLDMVGPMMAMMAPGTNLGDIPETMSPIAMGLSTGESGMHARLFVPADVIEFGAGLAETFGGGDDWDDAEEPGSRPRF